MHFDDLGSMPNGEAGIVTGLTLTFLFECGLVADKNDIDVEFFHSLQRALDTGCGAMVAPHRVERDLHARWCTHGWRLKDRLITCRPLGSRQTC